MIFVSPLGKCTLRSTAEGIGFILPDRDYRLIVRFNFTWAERYFCHCQTDCQWCLATPQDLGRYSEELAPNALLRLCRLAVIRWIYRHQFRVLLP
jgi:hypothetical protein